MNELRPLYAALPAVDSLMQGWAALPDVSFVDNEGQSPLLYYLGGMPVPRAMLREAANMFLDTCRQAIKEGRIREIHELDRQTLAKDFAVFVYTQARPHFRKVLNATGVVIHTNLGRSVLAAEAVEAVKDACAGYSNLELDLNTGERGSRYSHVEALLCSLTGAEGALVVNNNAAAVLLLLDTLCKGREVIVSRGQLVEIGGSFRIPEVMAKSGCILKEVGATNRTHVKDYADAIGENTAALMRVHTSNYRIIGFHGDVSLSDMVALGRERGLPVLEDLGSGYLLDFSGPAMQRFAHDEPSVRQVVAEGADIVSFSGDKVLGGPQAGVIVGKAAYIEQIKKNPLNRALRIDKMTLAALEATLRLYTEPELAFSRIPTLRMLCVAEEELLQGAKLLVAELEARFLSVAGTDKWPVERKAVFTVEKGESKAGGGAFPERTLPTYLVTLSLPWIKAETLRDNLLHVSPPMIVRLQEDKVCLDVRTLQSEEYALVADALVQAASGQA